MAEAGGARPDKDGVLDKVVDRVVATRLGLVVGCWSVGFTHGYRRVFPRALRGMGHPDIGCRGKPRQIAGVNGGGNWDAVLWQVELWCRD
jgi:hypothetical protein